LKSSCQSGTTGHCRSEFQSGCYFDAVPYFNALKALVDQAIAEGFIRAEHWHLLTMADDASTLLEMLSLKEGQET
jgi:hypothetical protein